MTSTRSATIRTGIAGGALFFLNALIPYCGAWPFVWAAVTGAVAFWLATSDADPHRVRRGMSAALIAGLIVGLIGFVGSTLTVLVVSHFMLSPAQTLGRGGPALVMGAAELGLAMVSLIAIVVTVVGGAVMIPVRWMRSSRSSAPAEGAGH